MPENPFDHGWIDVDEQIEIKWLNKRPAPDAILEFVTCGCKKTHCINNQCSCKIVGLPCTDLCNCVDCKNDNREIDFDESDSEDDDENEMDDEKNENFVSDDELDCESDFTDSDTDEES